MAVFFSIKLCKHVGAIMLGVRSSVSMLYVCRAAFYRAAIVGGKSDTAKTRQQHTWYMTWYKPWLKPYLFVKCINPHTPHVLLFTKTILKN